MKKITILLSLIVFIGLTIIISLFSIENESCYAQVKKQKLDKKRIEWELSVIKDLTNPERPQWALDLAVQYDLSESIDMVIAVYTDLLLNDPYYTVRKSAAEGLGHIGDKRAAPALKNAIEDSLVEVRIEAAGALVKLGISNDDKIFSTLEYFVRGKNIDTWNVRISFLENMTEEEREIYKNNHVQSIRKKAMTCIADINLPKTKSLLEDMTKDPNEIIRKWAEKLLKEKFVKK
ncbi:hypothetical protein AMJ80_01865 [bacterium SM23_31]|nr:MAG: hypothetical protein AMJ80_01865 [bacterium SM23_31]